MADHAAHLGAPDLSRRDFLIATSAAAAGLLTGSDPGLGAQPDQAEPTTRPAGPVVVQVQSDYVVSGRHVHAGILAEMLDWALTRITDAHTPAEAWHLLLKPDDIVGLKFNSSGAESLGTNTTCAEVLIRSLVAAGWSPSQIVPIEAPAHVYDQTQTVRPPIAWDTDEVDFGSGRDRLASWLGQVTAIINVPFLKTHNIAGLTCCLKNLSHAVVKHPARYHDNGCSPYTAHIVALSQIRDKLRLNIVNAIRIVFDRGPEAHDECTADSGMLLVGKDPVAVDTMGIEEINLERKARRLPYVGSANKTVGYLGVGEEIGLGCAEPFRIRWIKKRL